ncbi:putative ATP-dependent permease [Saccharomycopsis crataegensis]|uniref:ATP-dependent permease n=1 Tax=Saccharomycopsis crataegensis TaxID=43959 RepID=A0AAV5QE93_9ASCO|nr:putative ATP-dependent permease [Saccharomycopsis crataegensis]
MIHSWWILFSSLFLKLCLGYAANELPWLNNAIDADELMAGQSVFDNPTYESIDKCPPCFNCMLPIFECKQFSQCNEYTGQCECISGFGGVDCAQPVCGSLSDGNDHRPPRGENETTCDCKPGWSGINCNICEEDTVCDAFMPQKGLKGTCYKQGLLVNQFHQMCDVTNKKIVAILNGKKPQVTFSCNKTAENCNFQFWIDQKESFYCDLNTCSLKYDLASNTSHYQCEDVACKCLPDRMLCGEDGSIDISDFLTETIRGPGEFSCNLAERNCQFSEPSMNDLILSVFGDPYITLHCESGECIHYSEIPGYLLPPKRALSLYNLFFIAAVVLGVSCLIVVLVFYIKKSPLFGDSTIVLSDDDSSSNDGAHSMSNSTLISTHIPVSLTFENISYTVKNRTVLENAFGIVKPREMLAIMGGSGAGKTTLLDILAGKNKDGTKTGKILINGKQLTSHEYKKIIGFVDQEDYLIPTLTVYETVLNSALLRLPRNMPVAAKQLRVLEVLDELRILKIKDRLIGSGLERGISGGEKRRVAIACELVTSPSILFLDEPTSGLDSYNAKKVVECLVRLSRDYERTIVFTIHQPRSNIVALFDKLLLLSEGSIVYSGDMLKCTEFFNGQGYQCPQGYNIADYLIDITSDAKGNAAAKGKEPIKFGQGVDEENLLHAGEDDEDHHHDVANLLSRRDSQINTTDEWAHFASHRDELSGTLGQSQTSAGSKLQDSRSLLRFRDSAYAEEILQDIKTTNESYNSDANSKIASVSGLSQASTLQQIVILSSRTFKNLYRNPRLLMTQYLLSIFMGCFVGILYYDIEIDISGFQNRMGLFFFVLSFFGFSTLTGLHSFSIERIVFMRERSNNYYSSFSYYFTKILCDVLPLRVFPPVILLAITYPLVGLNMEENGFTKAIVILVLFNLATALEILIVGILIKESGNATLIGVLILLFSMLFSGLFINIKTGETTANAVAAAAAGTVQKSGVFASIDLNVLKYLSTFHYGYESLIINEVKTLVLRETKYGLKIEIPGATILSTFGFNVGALWEDVVALGVWCGVFLVAGFACLHFFVVERR